MFIQYIRIFQKHIKRVKERQKLFIELRDLYSVYVQKSFTDMLSLRQYQVIIGKYLIILYGFLLFEYSFTRSFC